MKEGLENALRLIRDSWWDGRTDLGHAVVENRYCLAMALGASASIKGALGQKLVESVIPYLNGESIVKFNDSHTKAEIEDVLGRAIAAEAQR